MSQLSSIEFFEISRALEKYHAVFYSFWQLGKPIFVEETETAFVQFDEKGDAVVFGINKKYWDSCSSTKKAFTICHECLHIIFNHGVRMGTLAIEADSSNIAADIVVNHELIKAFGFKREEIEGWEELCWIDTVFKDRKDVLEGQNLEYYYNLLKPDIDKYKKFIKKLLDDHKNFGKGDGKPSSEGFGNIIERIEGVLTPQELDSLKETIGKNEEKIGIKAGTTEGGMWKFMSNAKVYAKRKWETVIKNWCLKQVKRNDIDKEQWARTNRRFVFIDKKLILPTEMEVEDIDEEKDKIKVWFFLDTSGSCSGLADRFWEAAKSLPEDKFDVELYCFDTKVYEVNIKERRLRGFGGTSFQPIENYIQKNCKNIYPKAVFIISDGYGSDVAPQYPEKWHWFLTNNYTKFIPKKSKVYSLSKFE